MLMKKVNILLSSLYVLGFVAALYALYQLPTRFGTTSST